MGAPVREIVPIVALMGNHPVGISAFSYAGQLTMSVVADSIVCPEVEIIAAGLEDTLQSLRSAPPSAQASPTACCPKGRIRPTSG